MLELVPIHTADRLLWAGVWWLALAATWVSLCVWIDDDARRVFGTGIPWSLVFVTAGALLQFATLQYGFTGLWLFTLFFLSTLGAYLRRRDKHVAPTERILTRRMAAKILFAIATKIAMEDAFRKRFASIAELADEPPVTESVIFLKKNDRGDIDEHEGELSLALQHAQRIFATAIRRRATDIQIAPNPDGNTHVRCRIDGLMQSDSILDGKSGPAVISAMKVLADMNIAERRRPQDGTFRIITNGRPFEVRAATAPTNYGEKMALRLLDSEGGIVKQGIAGIGLQPSVVETLRSIIHQPHGMLLVCGPTGSGKTTTAYAAISEIDALARNIVTIEDPIECQLPYISQTGVNPSANLTFAQILRSLLRQDPDVILIGEIRDRETAEIAMQAALTGHFVFSTLHANDAATTVSRLLELGIDVTLLQSALSAVLAQRLIRLLCEGCKEPHEAPAELLDRSNLPVNEKITVYRPKGCEACGGKGYKGRTAIGELLVFDNRIREVLVTRPSAQTIRALARQSGMRTLRESAMEAVLRGITSIDEIARGTK